MDNKEWLVLESDEDEDEDDFDFDDFDNNVDVQKFWFVVDWFLPILLISDDGRRLSEVQDVEIEDVISGEVSKTRPDS